MKKKHIDHPDITRRDAIKGGVGVASLAALSARAAVPGTVSIASIAPARLSSSAPFNTAFSAEIASTKWS